MVHLKELDPGVDVVLLEQDICGGGPSGRNGGFVNSFWSDLDDLVDGFGDAACARACARRGEDVRGRDRRASASEHGVDAWFRNDGDLSVAASDAQVASLGRT